MSFTGNEGINIWETWLSDNTNLSGVNLLQLWRFHEGLEKNYIDILEILESLPAMETLVMYIKPLGVQYIDSHKAFVPMGTEETSGPNQSSWEGQISGVLCTRLEDLQIEGIHLTLKPEVMPILKDIVTLRAIIGYLLRNLTFYSQWHSITGNWGPIGRDWSFIMEQVPARRFVIEI